MVAGKLARWAQAHPETLQFCDELNREEVRWGFMSGAARLFIDNARGTADHDILTDELGFALMSLIIQDRGGDAPRTTRTHIESLDGQRVGYMTEEATITLDGKEIQVVLPTLMVSQNSSYFLSMTPNAAQRRLAQTVDGVTVYCAHPFDTILAKAAMQRGAPKQDIEDVRALAGHYAEELDAGDPYIANRCAEFRADGRVARFVLEHTGLDIAPFVVGGPWQLPTAATEPMNLAA